MDRAIWAVWYDMDAAKREAYFAWLHGTYLPGLVARPGIAWAASYRCHEDVYTAERASLAHTDEAIPQGTQFIQLIGAVSPHNFFTADSPLLEENLSAETRARLGERSEARTMVFIEEERVTGPDYDRAIPGGAPGPAIQMGSFNMSPLDKDFDIALWYAQLRMPAMSRVPSSIRTRKLTAIAGWARHSILYEFTSIEERGRHVGKSSDPLSNKIIPHTVHAPGSPAIAERIWPPV